MRLTAFLSTALIVVAGAASAAPAGSGPNDPINQHLARAQAAAGLDYPGLLARLCIVPPGGADARASAPRPATPPPPRPDPPPAQWYEPPGKVFDNLYWVGTKEHSAWLLRTSGGLVLIDTLFRYAVEPEIIEGTKKLGLDPKAIKYVVISHGHGDHDQGAKILQDLGAHILMSAADWDLMLNGAPLPGGNPRRDMVVTDGERLTLGDTTLTLYVTPGHTNGTVSLIFPVKDHGATRIIAYSGGTAFNFPHTPDRFDRYIATQQRFAKLAADAGATVVLSNHSEFDEAWLKVRVTRTLQPGEQSPFVIRDGVARYFTTMVECSEVETARLAEGLEAPAAR